MRATEVTAEASDLPRRNETIPIDAIKAAMFSKGIQEMRTQPSKMVGNRISSSGSLSLKMALPT
eukprot:2589811-Amphidinium_carterae.1